MSFKCMPCHLTFIFGQMIFWFRFTSILFRLCNRKTVSTFFWNMDICSSYGFVARGNLGCIMHIAPLNFHRCVKRLIALKIRCVGAFQIFLRYFMISQFFIVYKCKYIRRISAPVRIRSSQTGIWKTIENNIAKSFGLQLSSRKFKDFQWNLKIFNEI